MGKTCSIVDLLAN